MNAYKKELNDATSLTEEQRNTIESKIAQAEKDVKAIEEKIAAQDDIINKATEAKRNAETKEAALQSEIDELKKKQAEYQKNLNTKTLDDADGNVLQRARKSCMDETYNEQNQASKADIRRAFNTFIKADNDDDKRTAAEKIKEMMTSFGFGDQAIQNKYFSKAITTAQKRVEGNNFDARKQLLQYDDVMNTQREIMYGRRNEILDSESVHEQVLECMRNYVTDLVKSHTIDGILSEQDKKEIVSFANENLLDKDINENDISSLLDDDMIDFLYNKAKEEYEEKLSDVPEEITSEFEKALSLQVIDNYWMEQINVMSHLREGIYLRSYGQEDPLRAYSTEGFDLFDQMLQKIDHDVTIFLLKAEIQKTVERKPVTRNVQTNDDKSDSVKKPKKSKKVGRNDPCPCGSGKKYKQCCGK